MRSIARHRGGRPYMAAKAQMFAAFGTRCWHCGHEGAGEADHVVPLKVDPGQPVDYRGLRPSHGSNYPCPEPECQLGPHCNQRRGVQRELFRPRMEW
jgi:hypothetical protein